MLNGTACDWYVAGGWAIDLFLGRQTRDHGDLEIAILRRDFPVMRDYLRDFALHAVGDGEIRRIRAHENAPDDRHQNWVLDEREQRWRMDIMLEPGDESSWIFRRDESVRAPRREMVDRSGAIPFLRPQGVLLFKAKASRDKDDADLANCLPHMASEERAWLRRNIAKGYPGHDWLKAL